MKFALHSSESTHDICSSCGGIKVFPKVIVRPEVNSFSYIMLIAPFLSMIDGELPFKTSDGDAMKIDITKIEEAIEKGRGYYEFVATVDGKDVILRFNRSAFRNSYTMSDLKKLPSHKALQTEVEQLIKEKNELYNQYQTAKEETQRLDAIRHNLEQTLGRKIEHKKEQER